MKNGGQGRRISVALTDLRLFIVARTEKSDIYRYIDIVIDNKSE